MPFLTEELWHQLPQRAGARSIALDRFPEPLPEWIDDDAERANGHCCRRSSTRRAIIRAEMKIDANGQVRCRFTSSTAVRLHARDRTNLIRSARLPRFQTCRISFEHRPGCRSFGSTGGISSYSVATRRQQSTNALKLRDCARRSSGSRRISHQTTASGRQDISQPSAREHIVKGLETTLAERRAEFEKLSERLRTLEKHFDP